VLQKYDQILGSVNAVQSKQVRAFLLQLVNWCIIVQSQNAPQRQDIQTVCKNFIQKLFLSHCVANFYIYCLPG